MTTVAATVHGKAGKGSTTDDGARDPAAALPAVGKRTLIEALSVPGSAGVQRQGEAAAPLQGSAAAQIAHQGTESAGGPLPHRDRIQSLFGRHDITGVTAHQGPAASQAAQSLGARAYAHGNAVALPHLTGKEAATDIPSWARKWPDARPGVHEDGTTFATRMMNKKYGIGGWEKVGQHNTEFSQLKKFADRGFE